MSKTALKGTQQKSPEMWSGHSEQSGGIHRGECLEEEVVANRVQQEWWEERKKKEQSSLDS